MKNPNFRQPHYSPIKGLSPGHFQQIQKAREKRGNNVLTGAVKSTFARRFVPEITLTTCQGIGDIFWVYQKFFPYVGKMNIRIAVTCLDNIVQKRAFSFLSTWPRVGNVTLKHVPGQIYDQLAKTKYQMRDVMELGLNDVDYACNRWLEEGIRLEQIDPQYPPGWSIPLQQIDAKLDWEKYLCFYVCGSKVHNAWTTKQWAECLELLYLKYNLKLPLVIIGASYDANHAREVESYLKAKGNITAKTYIDLPPPQVHHVLAHAKFFVGYQSGLNVLADNLGCPQLMIYFPNLRPMLYAWCQPSHLVNRVFNADTFEHTPETVIEALHVEFPN
jgi:hypothetical protein